MARHVGKRLPTYFVLENVREGLLEPLTRVGVDDVPDRLSGNVLCPGIAGVLTRWVAFVTAVKGEASLRGRQRLDVSNISISRPSGRCNPCIRARRTFRTTR
jgi:hypothetical protein